MATTNIKKNASGYGYQYTDLAEIHNYLEANNMKYYQYVEPIDGFDYIMTVPIIGDKEMPPRRGCRVVEAKLSGKSNPAQEQGSALTYCRRYSLLMAFGLATTDDDAACLTRNPEEIEMQTISKVQAKTLVGIAKNKGFSDEWILDRCGVERLGEITNKQYAELMKELENL
jgi:hypothetical protein